MQTRLQNERPKAQTKRGLPQQFYTASGYPLSTITTFKCHSTLPPKWIEYQGFDSQIELVLRRNCHT